GRSPVTIDLGPESRELPGQEVRFAPRTFSTVEYRIDATNVGRQASYIGYSAVGLAELRVGDERVDEVVRLPRDLPIDADHALTVLLTRARSDPVPPRTDEEPAMTRLLSLPVARTFSIAGIARLSASVPDDVVNSVVGERGPVVRASAHLPGDLRARGSAALDGDPTTAWVTNLGPPEGQWLELDPCGPITVDRLRP